MNFSACCKATAIGSFPHRDVHDALRIVWECIPQVPAWPQLPSYPEEGMTRQYNEGMPGLCVKEQKVFFDTSNDSFDAELLEFYEDYLQALELEEMPVAHRFGMSPACARGIFGLRESLLAGPGTASALKGQIVGPITLATTLTDQQGRSAYYDARLREVVVKTLALKARWQIHRLREFGVPVAIFIDEPSLAAYGSSAFVGISEKDVTDDLQEVIAQIHGEGALAGIHCCENTDWSMLLATDIDILSFDAYGFFDRLVLYAERLKTYLDRGKILAWGIVPTGNPEVVAAETVRSLADRWEGYLQELSGHGFDPRKVAAQSLLTPSCGTGSLSPSTAVEVMRLLHDLSELLQRDHC